MNCFVRGTAGDDREANVGDGCRIIRCERGVYRPFVSYMSDGACPSTGVAKVGSAGEEAAGDGREVCCEPVTKDQ